MEAAHADRVFAATALRIFGCDVRSAAVGSAQFLRAPRVDRVVWRISAASFARAEFCPVLRRRYTQFAVLG